MKSRKYTLAVSYSDELEEMVRVRFESKDAIVLQALGNLMQFVGYREDNVNVPKDETQKPNTDVIRAQLSELLSALRSLSDERQSDEPGRDPSDRDLYTPECPRPEQPDSGPDPDDGV